MGTQRGTQPIGYARDLMRDMAGHPHMVTLREVGATPVVPSIALSALHSLGRHGRGYIISPCGVTDS